MRVPPPKAALVRRPEEIVKVLFVMLLEPIFSVDPPLVITIDPFVAPSVPDSKSCRVPPFTTVFPR